MRTDENQTDLFRENISKELQLSLMAVSFALEKRVLKNLDAVSDGNGALAENRGA